MINRVQENLEQAVTVAIEDRRAFLDGADGKVIWGGNPLNLSILDVWKLIHKATSQVDQHALRDEDQTHTLTITPELITLKK